MLWRLIIPIIVGGCYPEQGENSRKKWNTKNDPHIRIPAAFPGLGWDKLSGKKRLDSRAFVGHQVRCISIVFCQTERGFTVFSTGTENNDFKRFFKMACRNEERIGACTGLIFPHFSDPCFLPSSTEDRWGKGDYSRLSNPFFKAFPRLPGEKAPIKKNDYRSLNFSTTRTLSPRTVIGMGTTLS